MEGLAIKYIPHFIFGKDQQIFVDRGQFQGKSRSEFPNIDFNSDKVRIIGSLYKPEQEVLVGDELLTNSWPMVYKLNLRGSLKLLMKKNFLIWS